MKESNSYISLKTAIIAAAGKIPQSLREFHDDASLSEGKHLRGRTFLSFAGRVTEKTLKIAAAIELLHAATLIHDDMLDNASLRRGDDSLYVKRGMPAAALYGDYLFSKALSILSGTRETFYLKLMVRALSEIMEGEIVEMASRGRMQMAEKDYMGIIRKKTGVLFGSACRLGALARGLKGGAPAKAYICGVKAGMSYQIINDYYDYFFESGPDGSRFSDIKNRTATLPFIYLLANCPAGKKAMVEKITSPCGLDSSFPGKLVSLMKRYGVPDMVLDRADDYLEQSRRCLPSKLKEMHRGAFDIHKFIGGIISDERGKYSNSRGRLRRQSRF